MKQIKTSLITKTTNTRLHGLEKPVIGLTGGIATGKSAVTKELRDAGLEVVDADQLVKTIYKTDEAKAFIQNHWPQAIKEGDILFPELRKIFFADDSAKKEIEAFIYSRLPAVFKETIKNSKQNFIIYDVPLLFEKGLNQLTDLNVVVYSPRTIQKERLIKRDHIDGKLAEEILNQQEDIEAKAQKADFVISNTQGLKELAAEVKNFLLQVLD